MTTGIMPWTSLNTNIFPFPSRIENCNRVNENLLMIFYIMNVKREEFFLLDSKLWKIFAWINQQLSFHIVKVSLLRKPMTPIPRASRNGANIWKESHLTPSCNRTWTSLLNFLVRWFNSPLFKLVSARFNLGLPW